MLIFPSDGLTIMLRVKPSYVYLLILHTKLREIVKLEEDVIKLCLEIIQKKELVKAASLGNECIDIST